MTEAAVTTTPPEAPAVAEAPPKRRPKLSPELRELEKQLRTDAPDQQIRYGVCAGPKGQPHVEEVWLTWMDPGTCPACARPTQTWPLDPNGNNGGK